ncbi:Uncharacterized protein DBV15_02816 [Temnothorax longispinosus]|uniref:PDZ domain-containing protein n=1 Tax=Temnothorax longispinosus TaxID=300112 RepID=A0A4S2L232_9HYME|nr:Uncharacterized protein DBV15_02816 [Temnothorax longispinosus]
MVHTSYAQWACLPSTYRKKPPPLSLSKSKQHHGEGQPENFPCCSAVAEKSGAGVTAVRRRGCIPFTETSQIGGILVRSFRTFPIDRKAKADYEVNPGSKAAQQGVREGDLISNINGRSTRDLTNSEAHALLRNSGEQLKLGLNQENIGSPKRRIYRSSLQENTTTETQNSTYSPRKPFDQSLSSLMKRELIVILSFVCRRDHHKDHNDNAHTSGDGEECCQ